MIVDRIENYATYRLGPAWERAFAFLRGLTADSEEKEYLLDGERMFARVMRYPTRTEDDPTAVLEAHRRYVDIQMPLIGGERIACYATSSLRTREAYDSEKDVTFFEYENDGAFQLGMTEGWFACLLPQDAHMPQLYLDEPGVEVKKVVVKILLADLELG